MKKPLTLYYDKECPFCEKYSNYVNLKKEYEITLINVRDSKKRVEEFKKMGLDMEDGLILETPLTLFQGVDALKEIDKMLYKTNFIDKINSILLKSTLFKLALYPLLKAARVAVLKIKRKSRF